MSLINREEIRIILSRYKDAKRQHKLILKDHEVQSFYRVDDIENARRIIKARYPLGQQETINKIGTELVIEMTKNLEEFNGINPRDIYISRQFKVMLKIAERI